MKSPSEIRAEIDAIDDQLIDLYMKRLDAAAEMAEAKREANLPVHNPGREREILSRISEKVGPEFENGAALLYTTLFDISRTRQRQLLTEESALSKEILASIETTESAFPAHASVACQGAEGAFSQIAASSLVKFPTILFFNSFEDVFNAVEKGMCRYGILPIENSAAGSVTAVYDQMVKHNFRIVRAMRQHVAHVLLAPKGVKLSDIKEVTSHPQAISQCSKFLAEHSAIKATPATNTAVAARELAASSRRDLAVIASRQCADIYGLDIIAEGITNTTANFTRFICISKNLEVYPDSRKFSIMMSLPHRPGSLSAILAKFSAIGVNLTKLESRPIPGMEFEFRFTFDFEAQPQNANVQQLLSELSTDPEIEHFTFLGAYAEN